MYDVKGAGATIHVPFLSDTEMLNAIWQRLFEFRLDRSMVENVLGQLTESRGTNEGKL
jgi:hypothetical protein